MGKSALRSRNLGGPQGLPAVDKGALDLRGSGTPRFGRCLGPWAWEVAGSKVTMSGTEVRVGGVFGGAGEPDGQGIRVPGLVTGSKDMEGSVSGSTVGRSGGLGSDGLGSRCGERGRGRQTDIRGLGGRGTGPKVSEEPPQGPGTEPGLEGGE